MSEMIVLTAAEVAQVQGPTAPGAALDPVPLASGVEWVLPTSVLTDPAHLARRGLLTGLPRRTIAPEEWPAGPEDA